MPKCTETINVKTSAMKKREKLTVFILCHKTSSCQVLRNLNMAVKTKASKQKKQTMVNRILRTDAYTAVTFAMTLGFHVKSAESRHTLACRDQ